MTDSEIENKLRFLELEEDKARADQWAEEMSQMEFFTLRHESIKGDGNDPCSS